MDKRNLEEVTSFKLFTDSFFKNIDQDGLLSERIFGPTRSYHCACNKLSSKVVHENRICDVCGVSCISNESRYSTFAKIILPFPVLNYLKKNKLYRLVGTKNKHLLDPIQNDRNTTSNFYLKYDEKKDLLKIVTDYDSEDCVPLIINSLFTLYLALKTIQIKYNSESANEFCDNFYHELVILPPNSRKTVIISENGNNKILIHDLDRIYIKILKLKKYIEDKMQINTYELINQYLELLVNSIDLNLSTPILDDVLIEITDLGIKIQYYCNQVYTLITERLSGKEGMIRKSYMGLSIDFSARSVIVPDPSLDTYEIKLSKKIFIKLFMPEYYHFLKQQKYGDKWSHLQTSALLNPITKSDSNYLDDLEFTDEFIDYFFKEVSIKQRLVIVNRQPTLWRYGIPAVIVSGVCNEDVIKISPLIVSPLNADFDGDTFAIYRIHDREALNELFNNALVMNCIQFDHNESFLNEISMEAKYSYIVLTSLEIDYDLDVIEINSLQNLPLSFKMLQKLRQPVKLNNQFYSYGLCLLNYNAGFKTIVIKDFKYNLSEEIFKTVTSNEEYHRRLSNTMRFLNYVISVQTDEILTLPINEAVEILKQSNNNNLLSKLPKNPYIGNYIHSNEVDKSYSQIPKEYKLAKLAKAKFSRLQFSRVLISIGYIADDKNIIRSEPICNALLNGLDEDSFFATGYGSRKGLVDKDKVVPQSGYLERSLVINLSPVEIIEEDCKTEFGFNIKINDKNHANSLKNRYYLNVETKTWELYNGDVNKIGQELLFRSPITCSSGNFGICRKCFGEYPNIPTKYIGVVAGQAFSERLTQLSMSSFHTSGSATLSIDNDIKTFIYHNLKDIDNSETECKLYFNKPIPLELVTKFTGIPGFIDFEGNDIIRYENIENVENEDVTKIIKEVNNVLNNREDPDIIEIYNILISNILSIGSIYSSFIEVVLCNLFVNKDDKVIRYCLRDGDNAAITKKYGIKSVHKILSETLSVLYQPNHITIQKLHNKLQDKDNTISIFERIWLESL